MVKTAAKYQAYAEYKDSGVEWVGDIPSTWDVKPVLALFSSLVEKNTDGYESNVLSLSYGRIVRRDIEDNFGLLPESFNTYQIVKNGDIILRLTDLQNDKRSLRVGLVKEKGIITSAYLKLSANQHIDPRFAYRLLHSYDTTKVFYGMGGGLRQSMKFEDFKRLPILLPSKDEQTQIANFLDHETTKIDHLIEKQQQLIELLKEKRQAVISHAVTKGLDPNVPMKDSGVEWLGEVPEHWKVAPIKRIINLMEQGKSPECENIPATSDQWGVLKTSCVNNGVFHANQNKALPENIKPHTQYQVKAGDVLMSRASGSINLIGSVALVPENVQENLLLSDKIFRIHLSKDCDSRFFTLLLATPYMRTLIERAISGAEGMANNITKTAILEFISAIPPLDEQLQLVVYLNQKIETFNSLIEKSSRAIEVMQERRTALISAAVTGKIDVRNWQAPTVAEADTELSA